jgi:MFS family permease
VTVFTIFLLAYLLSQFFRSFLAVIAPELSAELAMTPAELGAVSAAWFIAFAFAQFPVGWALDHIGPRRTVPAIMMLAVAGCALFALATDTAMALAAMTLIGLGCAPIYMGALYYFGRTYDARHFALLSSWLLGIGSAGNLLAATPLAAAAEAFGWRTTFFAVAAITFVMAALVALLIKDPPSAQIETGPDTRPASAWQDFRALLALRNLWPFLPIALVSYGTIAVERGLWVGPYLSEVYGLDPIARGNIVLVMAVAMSLGAICYGPLDQWLGTRKWIVVAGTLATAAGFAALHVYPKPELAIAEALLSAVGALGLTYGVLMAHARSFMPTHLLGRGITAMNFLLIGGGALLQLVSGRLVEQWKSEGLAAPAVYANLHGLFAALLVIACAVYLLSKDSK